MNRGLEVAGAVTLPGQYYPEGTLGEKSIKPRLSTSERNEQQEDEGAKSGSTMALGGCGTEAARPTLQGLVEHDPARRRQSLCTRATAKPDFRCDWSPWVIMLRQQALLAPFFWRVTKRSRSPLDCPHVRMRGSINDKRGAWATRNATSRNHRPCLR
jgi:hypothetical protein